MWIQVSCPVATCSRNRTLNGMGSCLCGAFLIGKPSPRVKTIDMHKKGPLWQWHPSADGPSTILCTVVDLDDRGHERSSVVTERGFWAPVHAPAVKVSPDYRRAAHAGMPWRRDPCISTDPRSQRTPLHHAD